MGKTTEMIYTNCDYYPLFIMKKSLSLLLTLLIIPTGAFALTFAADDQLTIEPGSGDSYVAGEAVLGTTINGDLYAAGKSVMVQDVITNDANVAGETISLNNVGDDVRAAGSVITIKGDVGGHSLVFGETITLESTGVLNDDVRIGGATVTIAGTVNSITESRIYGESVVINGTINGPIFIEAEKLTINGTINGPVELIAETMNIDGATFNDSVRYWSEFGEVDFGAATVAQAPVYDAALRGKHDEMKKDSKKGFGFGIGAGIIYSLLSAALLLIIMLLLASKFVKDTSKLLLKTPWQSFFIGLIFYVAVPIVALLLLITVIGIPLSVIALFVWGVALWLSTTITALILTQAWLLKTKRKWDWWQVWLGSILMFFLLKIVMVVPIIGWIVYFIAMCAAMGAILQRKKVLWEKYVR
jgi:hypothetical protein